MRAADRTGAAATGACFALRRGGAVVARACDADDGEADGATTLAAPAGAYDLVETTAPDGFAAAKTRSVRIAAGKTRTATVRHRAANTPTPSPDTAAARAAETTASPTISLPFRAGFDSGDLAGCAVADGFAVVPDGNGGGWGRIATDGRPSKVWCVLASPAGDLFAQLRFSVRDPGNGVALFRLLDADGHAIAGIEVGRTGRLVLAAGARAAGGPRLRAGEWHELDLRVDVTGGTIGVWLDGAPVEALTGGADLGTALIAAVQFGEERTGRRGDLLIDDVVVDRSAIPVAAVVPTPNGQGPGIVTSPTPVPRRTATARPTPTPQPTATAAPTAEPTGAPTATPDERGEATPASP